MGSAVSRSRLSVFGHLRVVLRLCDDAFAGTVHRALRASCPGPGAQPEQPSR
ncbi:hypothetical protein GXW83_28070 [Streptacidiphilus sp. PB12-B1b]|uniref:hypothetical protein n=1 Tax=Streptacidiphilus sp. PB12-B1b TaxID=2705012 RepID=UPI0015FB31B3|nr:hypothetical protein [Streptacidiphilus sp. PB12-B1b]QMU78988.1 hypothetical protein GXW83_28070 [Streptacidiphilus sp. PB12-B1b]